MGQEVLDWGAIHNKKAQNDSWYVASMHPEQGGKNVVKLLDATLGKMSDVFEIGTGPGMNAMYLAKKGHRVEAQDISTYMGEIFQKYVKEHNLTIPLIIGSAQDYVPEKMYNAFVCTCVLHFMPQVDAKNTIEMMQKYTTPGGFNAFEVFTADSHCVREDRFYPTLDELIALYPDWRICENIFSPINISDGNRMMKLSLLLQKPL